MLVSSNALGPIKGQRTRDALADVLRDQILDGQRQHGSVLPAERLLVTETGLSRAAVRDALRILETEGLIETRPGRYGGSIVRQPASDALDKPIAVFVRGRQVSLREIVEVRVMIEPMVAELAAGRRTPEELAALELLTQELAATIDDVPLFLDANVRWYLALAEACHNDLLRAFFSSIAGPILEESGKEGIATAQTRQLILQSHHRVLQAVQSGDPAAARRRMERHVAGYAQHFLGQPQDLARGGDFSIAAGTVQPARLVDDREGPVPGTALR